MWFEPEAGVQEWRGLDLGPCLGQGLCTHDELDPEPTDLHRIDRGQELDHLEPGPGLELDTAQCLGDVALELGLERFNGVGETGVELEAVGHVVVCQFAHHRAEVKRARGDHGVGRERLIGSGTSPKPDVGGPEGDAKVPPVVLGLGGPGLRGFLNQ